MTLFGDFARCELVSVMKYDFEMCVSSMCFYRRKSKQEVSQMEWFTKEFVAHFVACTLVNSRQLKCYFPLNLIWISNMYKFRDQKLKINAAEPISLLSDLVSVAEKCSPST